jgi:S-adenosylmethionine:tRNA ribosyltransferase-isomerase
MKTSDFDYNLPVELIAQEPEKKRDHSRLLVLNKKTGETSHRNFYDILDFLNPGDVLVLNNSKVFPARLLGKKESTLGEVEIFLHKKEDTGNIKKNTKIIWECLVKGRVKENLVVILSKKLKAKLIKKIESGVWLVEFNLDELNFWREVEKIGIVPLPPYIKRDKKRELDKKRYQTVFCRHDKRGSVAAPTAGLHFNSSLLQKIRDKGIFVAFITLHVGLGTFAPVKTEDILEHKMHSEFVEIEPEVKEIIFKAKRENRRIIAVGTTSCRALESGADLLFSSNKKQISKISFWTDIFIYPGYNYKIIDGLVTNFHLPKSTLLMLVSALAGQENINQAYSEAIANKYRFFSYGDAMLII